MVRVLATGTFDLLHPGHLLYLSEAKALGDELYVIVARDSMIKHKPKPIIPEGQRLAMVAALRMVDKVMLGSETDMFEPLREIKPDIIALGKNQFFNDKELENQLKSHAQGGWSAAGGRIALVLVEETGNIGMMSRAGAR